MLHQQLYLPSLANAAAAAVLLFTPAILAIRSYYLSYTLMHSTIPDQRAAAAAAAGLFNACIVGSPPGRHPPHLLLRGNRARAMHRTHEPHESDRTHICRTGRRDRGSAIGARRCQFAGVLPVAGSAGHAGTSQQEGDWCSAWCGAGGVCGCEQRHAVAILARDA
jgi:hypothetical protein